jgi:enamine deaminase RidA (YjgF/YER057c/UK114 family)
MFKPTLACAAVILTASTPVFAADAYPLIIPAPGGEIILPDAGSKRNHDEWRFSTARRLGDVLYVSGVIVYRGPGEGNDVAAFKLQTRRALERLKVILEAAGASWADVAMINSFHVWTGPNFSGSQQEQFDAFEAVIGEFMKAPYPAWTAVGTTGLLGTGGIVEVQLIAHMK